MTRNPSHDITVQPYDCLPFPLYQVVAKGATMPVRNPHTLLQDVLRPLAQQAEGVAFCCKLAVATDDAQGSESEKVEHALELLTELLRVIAELAKLCGPGAAIAAEGGRPDEQN